jgi:hypothetical protein
MGELNNTVIAGVMVFVLGQLAARFVLEPLAEWRKLRGEIAHALHFYANVAVGEGLHSAEFGEQAVKHYRDLASQLWQRAHAIPAPLYWLLVRFKMVPSWPQVREVSAALTGLSNTVFRRESDGLGRSLIQRREEIREALRLKG